MPVLKEQGSASSKPAASPSPATPAGWVTDDQFFPPAQPRQRVVTAPYQLTAGEVQGQGPYPGIPGYATADDWTRVQATGMYSAPEYALELLRQAGYGGPAGSSPETLVPGLNMKAAEQLTPYSRGVSEEEARDLLAAYAPDAKVTPAELSKQRVETQDRLVPMTVAAYNKLTPEQRAAVDFNTALVEAREKDMLGGWMIRVPKDPSTIEARKSIFGEDAPTGGNPENVLRLLQRIGFQAPGTAKLEDFMSLDMGITAEELKNLELPENIDFALGRPKSETQQPEQGREINPFTGKPDPSPFDQVSANDYAKVRSAENLGMIQLDVIRRAAETLEKARAKGSPSGWSLAATASDWLGSGLRGEKVPFGWGTKQDRSAFTSAKDQSKDENFRRIFEILQNDPSKTKVAESDAFWARLKEIGYDEKDIDQLFEYLDQRTRAMLKDGSKVAEGQNDANIIRELAGLGPVNGN